MAFGLFNGTGEITPIIKYDARAGRMFRIDREDGESVPHDITDQFAAVFDFANVEVGWVRFAPGMAPDFVTKRLDEVKATGLPAKPTSDHRQAAKLKVKLAGPIGGDVREFAPTSQIAIRAIDALHTQYEQSDEAKQGLLPVVRMRGATAVKGKQQSTNYAPTLEIVKWVQRPADLGANAEAPAPEPVDDEPPFDLAPPATGSAPMEPADMDFG